MGRRGQTVVEPSAIALAGTVAGRITGAAAGRDAMNPLIRKVGARPEMTPDRQQVRSRQRVADHGEVFTSARLVDDMLDLVKAESERIDSRFLEPACGPGAFLVPVLRRKLATVQARHGKSVFEKRHYALLALMCIYGIELLRDNVLECRANLIETFADYLQLGPDDVLIRAARRVAEDNIVEGDALTMATPDGQPITFPEWGYLGRGRYQRRDFLYHRLTKRSAFDHKAATDMSAHDVFVPSRAYPTMTLAEIAG